MKNKNSIVKNFTSAVLYPQISSNAAKSERGLRRVKSLARRRGDFREMSIGRKIVCREAEMFFRFSTLLSQEEKRK